MTPQSLAALHHALSEVYSGAEMADAQAVADQLGDIGFEVTEKVSLIVAHRNPRAV